jgi:hypothetical protein
MTTILVSTGRRHVPFSEPSGYLHSIDIEQQTILRTSLPIEPAYREFDDNPRGGLRGCRGIAIGDDEIAIANSSIIFRYDSHWNLLGAITHPSCAGIHDILYQDDSIWVTATRSDLLIQFDLSGQLIKHYYLRDPSPALQALKWRAPILLKAKDIEGGRLDLRNPKTHDREAHNRVHINGVCMLPDGEIIASMGLIMSGFHTNLIRAKVFLSHIGLWDYFITINKQIQRVLRRGKNMHSNLVVQPVKGQSAVVRIDPQRNHTLVFASKDMTVPSHSLMTMPDGTIIYLNTTEGKVIHFNLTTHEIISSTKVTDGFLRGATHLGNGFLALGSKQEILLFDLEARRIQTKMKFTADINEAVYDIKMLPEHYLLPPDSLEAHFRSTTGFNAQDIVQEGRLYRP